MTDSLTITARHNGPPGSANGGYTCGLLAQQVSAEAIEVTLRKPPPLERPLEVAGDAEHVELRDGERLVAEARPAELLLDVPEAVPADELERAEAGGHEHWTGKHPFPTCFVCGPDRAPGDGLRIFPLELPGHDGMFGAPLAPGRVARRRRRLGSPRVRLGRARLPDERAGRQLRRGAADGARPHDRATRLLRPHGRAALDPVLAARP